MHFALFGSVILNEYIMFSLCSLVFDIALWYNTLVNNSDLLVGRSGWLFMCGLHPLSQ